MLFPKCVLEDLSVGSGSIIGKSNIEDMLEARFASLNPFMQYMFLKLHKIENSEKKAFILETLRIEFKDIAIEAREVFKKFNKLGTPIEVVGTPNEDFRVPIPCKLVEIHDAWEKNSSWICPENPFDESSVPKREHKGSSKTHLDTIQFIVEKTPIVDLNASFEIT
jgi:hypothetical protein